MNKLIYIFALLLFPMFAEGQLARFSEISDEGYQIAEIRKKEGIKKITIIEYTDSLSYSKNMNGDIKSIKVFNENGDEIERYSKDKKTDSIYLSSEISYDNYHRLLEMKSCSIEGSNCRYLKAIFEDSIILSEERHGNNKDENYYFQKYQNGKLLYEVSRHNGTTRDSSYYFLDKYGRRIKSESYIRGEVNTIIKLEYLVDEDYIERIFNVDGSLRLKRYYKYDRKGNELERVEYDSNEEIRSRISYKYDCDGNEVESKVILYFKSHKISNRSESEYEKDKLIKQTFFDENDDVNGIWMYYYNDIGLNYLQIRNSIDNKEITDSEVIFFKIEY